VKPQGLPAVLAKKQSEALPADFCWRRASRSLAEAQLSGYQSHFHSYSSDVTTFYASFHNTGGMVIRYAVVP